MHPPGVVTARQAGREGGPAGDSRRHARSPPALLPERAARLPARPVSLRQPMLRTIQQIGRERAFAVLAIRACRNASNETARAMPAGGHHVGHVATRATKPDGASWHPEVLGVTPRAGPELLRRGQRRRPRGCDLGRGRREPRSPPARLAAMPPSLRAPRGTRDLLPDERAAFARLERIARDLASRYGYREMETPLFEQAAVFERGIGAVTDVVEKELFRVAPSRGEEREAWALRPEATAGICRAYVEHGLQTWPQPVRLSLIGPMFRYDRPQAGRYRQFWQWDVEAIGDPGPAIDAELVELGARFYRDAGLADVELLLNSIGDPACRPAYLADLVAHYRANEVRLPDLERRRLETNPLRLLDSKDPAMAEVNASAPRITDHLCPACAEHFGAVRAHLDAMGVAYRVEPGLVRGLDYYARTAFEFYRHGAEGQQQALGGGGRYDGLIELLGRQADARNRLRARARPGGPRARIRRAEPPTDAAPVAVVVGADPGDTRSRLRIATELRGAGLPVRADLSVRKLGRQLEAAVRERAQFAVILGDELAAGEVQLRDLDGGSQKTVPLADLPALLRRKVRG